MRQPGHYWVRLRKWSQEWNIGRYIPGTEPTGYSLSWEVMGTDETFNDSEFAEIGAFICSLTPEEK